MSAIYYINSKQRLPSQVSNDSNFTYSIQLPHNHNFKYVSLLSASIPKSYYLISSINRTFTLNEYGNLATISLNDGNYTLKTFRTALLNALNNNSPNSLTYTIDISAIGQTGKFVYGCSETVLSVALQFTDELNEQMGFAKDSTNYFNAGTLTSVNVINLQLEASLFIHSDICLNPAGDDVLQDIFMNSSPDFSFIAWENPTPGDNKKRLNSNLTNSYNFALRNEDGKIVNTNGINIVLTVCLTS